MGAMNILQKVFIDSGLRRSAFCRKFGISYPTFFQHLTGTRRVSPEMAIFYEEKLGIPRSELRPDLWPPEEGQPPVGPTMPHHQASTPEPHEISR